MSGLVKAKEYDWKDSNVAKLGSKEDRQVRIEKLQTLKSYVSFMHLSVSCKKLVAY